ncbi:PREDICTED: AN1-type zinc finger protein 5-like [Ipomoea nil]|uniref:AN1-type zinc finger protein 5-like n=1 Tax=Ipomoea nil TaxID=35883 RepID=UPI000901D929|nr:PREDICTED: AN1-type zinc finger protein 5-like [Ipomoea nil]
MRSGCDLRSNPAWSPQRSETKKTSKASEIRSLKMPRDVCGLPMLGSGMTAKIWSSGIPVPVRGGVLLQALKHRYSDRHNCLFDYKVASQEAIVRENPVVRAAKILKL